MERTATSTILIRGARQLLTLRGPNEPRRASQLQELSIIHDGSLLIQDGVLVEVGATRRVENLAAARAAIEVSAAGRVVMPPPGSFGVEAEPAARALRAITGMRLETRARLLLEAMARHGTTTVEVKTGCGPDPAAEMKILRVLAGLKREPVDVIAAVLLLLGGPAEGGSNGTESVSNWICDEFLPKIRRRRLAAFVDVLLDEPAITASCFERYLQAARALGLGCKVHAQAGACSSAVAVAVAHGASSVDHLENATVDDAALLAKSDTIATVTPCASFHRDGYYAPARMLIEAGAAVALATNFNPQHTPTLNMQTVIKLACARMGMAPAEAISAATINGAHALGCADRAGSLAPGKSADLLILNISDHRELAHHLGANLVYRTMKRGEFIYEEGEVAPRPVQDMKPAW